MVSLGLRLELSGGARSSEQEDVRLGLVEHVVDPT